MVRRNRAGVRFASLACGSLSMPSTDTGTPCEFMWRRYSASSLPYFHVDTALWVPPTFRLFAKSMQRPSSSRTLQLPTVDRLA